MKKFFIGSDISKSYIDVSYHNGIESVYLGQFTNDYEGFQKMIEALKECTDCPFKYWFVCFENTGVYSKPLAEYLYSRNIAYREESGLQINYSLGIKRGKNDKADSMDICQYCFEKKLSIKASEPIPVEMAKLRKLLSRRELLVRQKTALSNSLCDQKFVLKKLDLHDDFRADNKVLIDELNKQIKRLENEIEKTIAQDEVMQTNYELGKSVIGIGLVTSATFLAFTLNYSCFTDARKFSCFSGAAPFGFQSGSSIKRGNQVSHLANKKMKALLSNCVASAIQYDKELKQYYHRKLAEGKDKGVVLNAVKNKLIHRVFAVIKRQTPFVPMKTYA